MSFKGLMKEKVTEEVFDELVKQKKLVVEINNKLQKKK
jgi:hypothetical protein